MHAVLPERVVDTASTAASSGTRHIILSAGRGSVLLPCYVIVVMVRPQVRHVGVSNETSWGVTQFVAAAERAGLPKIVSIQNSYHLLNRGPFETDLVEVRRLMCRVWATKQCSYSLTHCMMQWPQIRRATISCHLENLLGSEPQYFVGCAPGAGTGAIMPMLRPRSNFGLPRCARRGSATSACWRTARCPAER